ncbi:hypothetical protein G7046_g794 [Stylonectria norvegica]|nr:hypothetical protein G7046_g794 [Stylonectria norvegica]
MAHHHKPWTSVLRIGLAALSWASLVRAGDVAYVPWNVSAVLDFPPTIAAGKDTTVHMNFSNSVKAVYEHQFMEIYAYAWPRVVTEDDPTSSWPDLYCEWESHFVNSSHQVSVNPNTLPGALLISLSSTSLLLHSKPLLPSKPSILIATAGVLEECVATSLSTFVVNVPADAFPSGRMKVSYTLSRSDLVGWSTWGDQSTLFNLTDGEAALSPWEVKQGWGAVSHWTTRLPCSSVPCARSCIEQYLDIDKPTYTQPKKAEFSTCVQSCKGIRDIGDYSSQNCVMVDETAGAKSTATDEAVASSTASATSSTASPTGAGPGERIERARIIAVVLVVGVTAMWAMFF